MPGSMGHVRALARQIPFARVVWRMLRVVWRTLRRPWSTAPTAFSAAAAVPAGDDVRWADVTSEWDGFEAYQVAALKQMPDIAIPEPSETISGLPDHVRIVLESGTLSKAVSERVSTSALSELSQAEFEQLLTARALERGLPVDILSALFAAGPKLDDPGHVLQLMQTYWRRLIHWNDIRDLAAMIMRRQFDWGGAGDADPVAAKAGQNFRDDGYAVLPNILSPSQAAEIHDYLISRPGLNRHVPDGCPDQIRRYMGYGADDYPFCTYPLCDIALAPHLLEAVVNPRIVEIGWRGFGAIPRLWKIFTHWDLVGSKFLASGTSIGHYHRDLNDVGMMWVYVYLSDVDRDCGPHGIVPGSQSLENITAWLQEARDLGADTRHGDRHLAPEDFFDGYGYQIRLEVKEAMFANREVVITGPAGTTIVSNGFNYHRIVSPQTKRRLLCAARYYLTHPQQLESPDRDTDKIPFGLVKDRIGDSELIREMTAGVVDWRSPRSPRRTTERRLDSGKKYFLVVSNGRTGSTWLSISLGRLDGVRTDFEYRWGLPRGAEGNPIHYVIPHHQATVVESLDSFAGDASVIGSKLVFSLEWTQRQNVFEKLDLYFDDRITYVFLTRSYLETLASFLLRGPVHGLVKSETDTAKENVMLRQLRAAFDRPAVGQRPFDGDERDVFRALKSLVNNDVIGFGICQRFPNRVHLSYDRISADFEKIARAAGWSGDSREARKVIDAPLVKKLPVLDCSSFPRADLFAEYANRMNATLRTAIIEEWTVDDLHRTQTNTLDALRAELNSPCVSLRST